MDTLCIQVDMEGQANFQYSAYLTGFKEKNSGEVTGGNDVRWSPSNHLGTKISLAIIGCIRFICS
jgi:hypothetical protein